MHAEQLEIAGFLQQHPPFNELPEPNLNQLAQHIEIGYYRAGRDILQFREPIQDLYVVRSGVVETFRRTGELYNRLGEGGIFGHMGLMLNHRVRFPVKALEDTLVYCIPVAQFNDLCERFDAFADFFETEDNALLRHAISAQAESNDLTTVKVKALITRELVTCSSNTSIQDAALQMTEQGVSVLLVTNAEPPSSGDSDSHTVGILTDRDIRSRVIAEGLSFDKAVGEVMSENLITLDDNTYVFEAMLSMLRFNVHHLPIMHDRRCIGVVSMSDILRHESQSSILLARGIFAQQNIEGLQHYAQQLPAVFVRMVNEDANSHMIGNAMAVIGRSFKQRLLELAEEELGPPPVPYSFLALGSMARDEQLLVTDQDNAIILHNDFQEDQHGRYFENIAKFVSDGLAECGYPYCSGNIMATNPEYRLSLDEWKYQFSNWIEKPQPKTLLNSCIFFDLDSVWGEESLADELRRFVANKAPKHRVFLANMARNALNRTPPLGFFKDFVLEQDGKHKKSINLKRRGTAPLTDAIRVHALAIGSRAQNSFERIEDIKQAGLLPAGKAQDLSDALEYLSIVRARHQAQSIQAGEEPDNNVQPDMLSSFERRNLKEAFRVLDNAQNFLKFRYKASALV
ncbi:Hypoxic response protein 1 [Zhongshania aliphaticivorans]|uniref:Hypoxic response protein 1 n=1 Tax=Zhongshania aliphaticivorans TaxID=1470434 RepID=A0A5S9NEH7_9GAMM|nr:putative nucleotidyltransferase substrate binding domain-containing protein [Zhongshania aliphaticivorans]CAA0078220.1 Hypoxic response protein 1 [Zhongshania aliphaticivorans]CAA0086879.1 Hypoxic response protein 1 [Zhongshania aliphaticivorans]